MVPYNIFHGDIWLTQEESQFCNFINIVHHDRVIAVFYSLSKQHQSDNFHGKTLVNSK